MWPTRSGRAVTDCRGRRRGAGYLANVRDCVATITGVVMPETTPGHRNGHAVARRGHVAFTATSGYGWPLGGPLLSGHHDRSLGSPGLAPSGTGVLYAVHGAGPTPHVLALPEVLNVHWPT
jgi:hypothetical protein